MWITIDASDRRPIYEQVADGIKALIARRELTEGQALPPVRQLAGDLGVNLNTIAVAYRGLQDEGLISIRHGSGAVVTARRTTSRNDKELRRTLGAVLTQMVLSGLARAEIMDAVATELGSLEKGGEVMTAFLASVAVLVWAVRLSRVRGMWRLPSRNGEDFFLAQRVGPGFYGEGGAGAHLLRRYHLCLFLPLALDAPLVLWLVAAGRYPLLVCEQWVALILTAVVYNVALAHFSARAAVLVGPDDQRPATTVQLSMAPRRLRDHSNRWVELAIAVGLLISLVMLVRAEALAAPVATVGQPGARALRKAELATAWILYLQAGLLLLKVVFVRWRMPLPVRRTEDFRRWRAAWLSHHLKVFDASRVMLALLQLSMMVWLTSRDPWPRLGLISGLLWTLAILAFTLYLQREVRRLAAVEREIRPIELVKEFPRPPIPEGRFLAGGLLYWSRDNPGVLVRSPQGIALNLGHASTYAWGGYFIGLALLMTWLVR